MKLRIAEPIGQSLVRVSVTESVAVDEYRVSLAAEHLRVMREAFSYTLKEAAALIGVKPEELRGLETGRLVFEMADDWQRCFQALEPEFDVE